MSSVSPAEPEPDLYLAVRGLRKYFPIRRGVLSRTIGHVQAVDGIDFAVGRGQTLSLVGESGCGKTTTARLILHLEKPDAGEIVLQGKNTVDARRTELRAFRRQVQMVFQDPYASLNPHKTAGQVIGEALRVHNLCSSGEIRDHVSQILETVNLPPDAIDRYPHEFSGGQRQRLGIARALAVNPKVIVCDEPVSALDVSIRSQIINLLLELQERLDLTYVFVAHDLGVVEHVSDTVAVMYLGKIVEYAPAEVFFAAFQHPYSEALLSAVPEPNPGKKKTRIILSGDVPSPINPPSGCRFRTRCPLAEPRCAQEEPPLRELSPGHRVACHLRG